VFADGHDVLSVVLRDRHDEAWRETPMRLVDFGADEWRAAFDVQALGWHEYQIVAWVDRFLTWRRDLRIKADAGQDVSVELLEGAILARETAERAHEDRLLEIADALTDDAPVEARVTIALDEELAALMARHADRASATVSPIRRVWVDRERARFSA